MRLQILAFILFSFIASYQCQAAPDNANDQDSLEYDYEPLLQSGASVAKTGAQSSSSVSGKSAALGKIKVKLNGAIGGRETTTPVQGWDFEKNYELNDTNYRPKYRDDSYEDYNKGRKYNNNNNYDKNYDNDEYRSGRHPRSPDKMNHLSVYVRDSSKRGRGKKYQRIRLPAAQYKRRHFPGNFNRLITLTPWVPIFIDPLTKQTIIHSPVGGVIIIPPIINFIGKRFAVGELIAWGYASLVSTGAPPPPALNIAPLVQPGPVVGPGIPRIDHNTGGFDGGVRTQFRSFPRPDYPKSIGVDDYESPRSYGSERRGGYY